MKRITHLPALIIQEIKIEYREHFTGQFCKIFAHSKPRENKGH